jgi:hypothetical protein
MKHLVIRSIRRSFRLEKIPALRVRTVGSITSCPRMSSTLTVRSMSRWTNGGGGTPQVDVSTERLEPGSTAEKWGGWRDKGLQGCGILIKKLAWV